MLRLPSGHVWAIEIKRTSVPKLSQGFHIAAADIKADVRILLFACNRDVPIGDAIRAMPLDMVVQKLRLAR